jgi:hypothetical protein
MSVEHVAATHGDGIRRLVVSPSPTTGNGLAEAPTP